MISTNRLACLLTLALSAAWCMGQNIDNAAPDKWVNVTAAAAGTNANARDEAVATALRKGVEQACGVFLTAESKTRDYQATYDKVFANAVGFVKEHKVVKEWVEDGKTFVTVRALVSTQKFAKDWSVIAHTVNQENNPRVIVAIAEATTFTNRGWVYASDEGGTVQSKIEDFFLSKGVQLMDRQTAVGVSKRDLLLAVVKDDAKEAAALGLRFHADVVVMGQATAKYGNAVSIGDQRMHQYPATLNVRVVQTDSARLLVSKNFNVTYMSALAQGGEGKALTKLAEESAPKLLAAVVEAWRSRANVSRTIQLSINGMDFAAWKTFKTEVEAIDGIQAVRMREISVDNIASLDIEYRFTNEILADKVTSLKSLKLKVSEITANRIKLAVQP